MSDLKRDCPACGGWSSAIGRAFMEGNPCPWCGLPAEVARTYDEAVKRGANKNVAQLMAKAEQRATKAEREVERLRGVLARLRFELDAETEVQS